MKEEWVTPLFSEETEVRAFSAQEVSET